MKKVFKGLLSLTLLAGLFLFSGCDLESLGGLVQNSNEVNYDDVKQLNQIYELAKAQGYEGT